MRPTTDPVCATAITTTCFVLGRATGSLLCYALPEIIPIGAVLFNTRLGSLLRQLPDNNIEATASSCIILPAGQ